MGYSRKKQTGGLKTYFCEPPPGTFHFSYLPLEISNRRVQPLEIIRSFGNSKVKNQDHWKFHIIFYGSPLEISLCFLLTPGNSTCYFFDNHGKFISPTTPPTHPILFFSGIAHCTKKCIKV